jgi:hypothetical protein
MATNLGRPASRRDMAVNRRRTQLSIFDEFQATDGDVSSGAHNHAHKCQPSPSMSFYNRGTGSALTAVNSARNFRADEGHYRG